MTDSRDLFVWEAGAGARALCLHGSGGSGENFVFLAERIPGFHIVAPDRPNYGRSRDMNPSTLDGAVTLLGEFLDEGAHLFGQSYGGVLCLLIAARWPDRVLSLAVNEPPAFQLAKDDANVKALLGRLADVYPARPTDSPTEWLQRWGQAVNVEIVPARTPQEERADVAMMREQLPWEPGAAAIDLERIARAPFPKLILSGGWHPAFGAVCDVLEARLGARRVDFPGVGHGLAGHRDRWVPVLREFWESADRLRGRGRHGKRR
jgi:pimeloyl-ACP methyl ester carboxylesterase